MPITLKPYRPPSYPSHEATPTYQRDRWGLKDMVVGDSKFIYAPQGGITPYTHYYKKAHGMAFETRKATRGGREGTIIRRVL